jgi:hypothetical protein
VGAKSFDQHLGCGNCHEQLVGKISFGATVALAKHEIRRPARATDDVIDQVLGTFRRKGRQVCAVVGEPRFLLHECWFFSRNNRHLKTVLPVTVGDNLAKAGATAHDDNV